MLPLLVRQQQLLLLQHSPLERLPPLLALTAVAWRHGRAQQPERLRWCRTFVRLPLASGMPVSRGRSGLAVALSRRSCSASLYSLLDRAIRRCGPHLPVSGWDAEADSPSLGERRANRAGGRRRLQTSADIVRLFMKPDKRKRSEELPAPASASGLLPTAYDLVTAPMAPTPAARWVPTGSRTSVPAQCSRWHRWKLAYPPSAPPRKGPHLPAMAGPATFLDAAGLWPRWIGGACLPACATRLRRDRVLLPPSASPQRPPQTRARWRRLPRRVQRDTSAVHCCSLGAQTAVASPRRPPLQISPRRPGRRDSQHCPSLAAGRSSLGYSGPAGFLSPSKRSRAIAGTDAGADTGMVQAPSPDAIVSRGGIDAVDAGPAAKRGRTGGVRVGGGAVATSSASCQAAQRLLRTLEMLDVPPLVQTKAAVARLAPPAAGDSGADSAATPAPPLGFDGGSARSTGAGQACLSALSAAPPTRSCVDMTPASTATSRAGGPLADSPALFGTSSASGATEAAASAASRISSKARRRPRSAEPPPARGAPKPASPASMVSERRAGR